MTDTNNTQPFDCEGNDKIVCPFCGYAHDPVDSCGNPGIHVCCECGNSFEFAPDFSVSWSTQCLPMSHEFGDWKICRGQTARFCTRCGFPELRPGEPMPTGDVPSRYNV